MGMCDDRGRENELKSPSNSAAEAAAAAYSAAGKAMRRLARFKKSVARSGAPSGGDDAETAGGIGSTPAAPARRAPR